MISIDISMASLCRKSRPVGLVSEHTVHIRSSMAFSSKSFKEEMQCTGVQPLGTPKDELVTGILKPCANGKHINIIASMQ